MSNWLIILRWGFFGVMGLLAVASFWLLFRQWRSRHQPHLLLASLGLLFAATAIGLRGLVEAAPYFWQLADMSAMWTAIAILVWCHFVAVALATVAAYVRRRAWLTLPMAVGAAVLLWAAWLVGRSGGDWVPTALTIFDWNYVSAVWLMTASLLLLLASFGYRSKRIAGAGARADWWLMMTGIAGVLTSIFIRLGSANGDLISNAAAILFGAAYLMTLTVGMTARWHGDPNVLERPSSLIFGRVAVKSALLALFISATGLLLLTGFLTSFFARLNLEQRQASLAEVTAATADWFNLFEKSWLTETAGLARQADFVANMTQANVGEEISYQPSLISGTRAIARVYGSRGQVIWSDVSELEIGRMAAGSVATIKALAGFNVAGLEPEPSMNDRLMLTAAAPIVFEDGSVGALSLVIEPRLPSSTFERGYGLALVEDSGPVLQSGDIVWSDITQLLTALGNRPNAVLTLANGAVAAAASVYATDGRRVGAVALVEPVWYAQHDLLRATFAALLLILLLSLAAALLTLWYVGRHVRQAVRVTRFLHEFESGQPQPILVGSHDELGRLAETANRIGLGLLSSRESLRRTTQEMTDFMTNAANEMRTPLSVLRWGIDLMRFGDVGRLNRGQAEMVEQLHQTAARLQAMTRNISDAVMFERGQVQLKLTSVAMEDVIERAAGELAIRLREKEIDFQLVRHNKRSKTRVTGDAERLHQIVLNLLSNAVKYVDVKGRISVTVNPTAPEGAPPGDGRFVEVVIEDDGRGIPSDQQESVFAKFFRASNVLSDDVEGAGLGLHVVKQLVELHGGEIWFESVEGAGTTFHFTIPKSSTKK